MLLVQHAEGGQHGLAGTLSAARGQNGFVSAGPRQQFGCPQPRVIPIVPHVLLQAPKQRAVLQGHVGLISSVVLLAHPGAPSQCGAQHQTSRVVRIHQLAHVRHKRHLDGRSIVNLSCLPDADLQVTQLLRPELHTLGHILPDAGEGGGWIVLAQYSVHELGHGHQHPSSRPAVSLILTVPQVDP